MKNSDSKENIKPKALILSITFITVALGTMYYR